MYIIFQDQAEYYFVCQECYEQFRHMQWAGSTRSYKGWREVAYQQLNKHEEKGKPCEFCGPNGNGGWMIDGRWPAAERRDTRKSEDQGDE